MGGFEKGMTPWNKGKAVKGNTGKKGMRGFSRRAVVDIAQSGEVVRRWKSVTEAAAWLGAERHSVAGCCRGRYRCRGHKLMYEDEWSPLGDFRWKPAAGRNVLGQLQKGHKCNSLFVLSEEARNARRERGKRLYESRKDDPNWLFGKYRPQQKVRCVNTGVEYDSEKAAAEWLGVPPNYIADAIRRNGKVRGMKFVKI